METQSEATSTAEDHEFQTFRFSWTIDNFTKLNKKKLYSKTFVVGKFKWRVVIYPKGDHVDHHLSMYLDVADSAVPYVRFSLSMVNQIYPLFTVRKVTHHHQFNARESDWGFTHFMSLSDLHDPRKGYLVNDTCMVEAVLAVRRVINYCSYDKRRYKAPYRRTIKIGKNIYFDLVDHDKVYSFSIQNQMPFELFKEEVAKEFGIPVHLQRFWIWTKRKNRTYRPHRPLTLQEEAQSVGQLRTHNAQLKLFLEVELGLDLCPISLPAKTKEDILLFFKLYDPEKEELRYVGRLFVRSHGKPMEIISKLNEMAGFAPMKKLNFLRFKPRVSCDLLDKRASFRFSQIVDGDIICFQKSSFRESEEQCRFRDVPSFLEYVRKPPDCSFSISGETQGGGFLSGVVKLSHPNAELRLLEVRFDEIYGVFPLNQKIKDINDEVYTLRAEETPEEEKNLGPLDRYVHIYHFTRDPSENRLKTKTLEDPVLLVIREGDTLGEVKVTIQKKLQLSEEEVSKWKFVFFSLDPPECLQDSDIVSSRVQTRLGYLGFEHPDDAAPKVSI